MIPEVPGRSHLLVTTLAPTREEGREKGYLMDQQGASQQGTAALYFPHNRVPACGDDSLCGILAQTGCGEPGGADKWGPHTSTSQAFGALLE